LRDGKTSSAGSLQFGYAELLRSFAKGKTKVFTVFSLAKSHVFL